jgi:hypothetical protein
VGIGTSSPSAKLDVRNGANVLTTDSNTSPLSLMRATLYNGNLKTGAIHTTAPTVGYSDGGGLAFATMLGNNAGTSTLTDRMYIDDAGNLLLGGTSNGASAKFISESSANANQLGFRYTGVGTYYWGCDSSGNAILNKDGTERMRIDSSGNLLVGTTSQVLSGKFCLNYSAATFNGIVLTSDTTGASGAMYFRNPNGSVGVITTSGSATTYGTSSDYRLKENIAPMTGALATVAQIKPVTYKWKADGSDGQGFIAHELQAIVPDCVVGEKDALDTDGNPKYQGVDTSFLVATLTAAIQEQQATINALTARIVALENK